MSERIKGFTVELDVDINEEDFLQIENAVRMIKHVRSVTRNIVNTDDYINRERVRNDLRYELYEALNGK